VGGKPFLIGIGILPPCISNSHFKSILLKDLGKFSGVIYVIDKESPEGDEALNISHDKKLL